MSMELQLSTKQAQAALEAFEAKLAQTEARLKGFDVSGVQRIQAAVAGLKGPAPAETASIVRFADALRKLSGTSRILSNLAGSLTRVGGTATAVTAASTAIFHFQGALNGLHVPPGLGALAGAFRGVGNAARGAAGQVQPLNRVLGSIRPPNLGNIPNQLAGITQAAGAATQATTGLSGSFGSLSGAASALLGVGLAAGLRGLVSGAMDAAQAFLSFDSKMQAAGQTAAGVQKEFRFIDGVTARLAIPLETALSSFGKMSVAMNEAGLEA